MRKVCASLSFYETKKINQHRGNNMDKLGLDIVQKGFFQFGPKETLISNSKHTVHSPLPALVPSLKHYID